MKLEDYNYKGEQFFYKGKYMLRVHYYQPEFNVTIDFNNRTIFLHHKYSWLEEVVKISFI